MRKKPDYVVSPDYDSAATIADKLLSIGQDIDVLVLASRAFDDKAPELETIANLLQKAWIAWREYSNSLFPEDSAHLLKTVYLDDLDLAELKDAGLKIEGGDIVKVGN